jgi:hypothetical protein
MKVPSPGWERVSRPLKKAETPFDKLRVSGKGPLKLGWGSAHAELVEAWVGFFNGLLD